ncbi:MAG: hypothetical protein JWR08_840 [Enterovirga sp.]|nr:hypothetical protein [Enterovirga sp.]
MTIGAYGTAAFAAAQSTELFRSIKSDFATVQAQLSTGAVATTHAGLGSAGAAASLTLRSKLATLGSYGTAIADGTLRVNLMAAGLAQLNTLATQFPTKLTGSVAQPAVATTDAITSARQGFDMIVDVLNMQTGGRYLFAGRESGTEPVAASDLILNGDAGRAGLKTLIAERKAADAGPDGMGRTSVAASGSAVTIAEEAGGLPFGLKLAGAEATGTGLVATLAAGPPAAATVTVGSQPVPGDTIGLTLTLPDGSESKIALVAGTASAGSGATGFAIGATTDETAANISAALAGAVGKVVATELPSASAMSASSDFFAADAANPPLRVAGPPYDTATAQVAGTAANTVIWYAGGTSAAPRDTAALRISDTRTIGIGAQADEPAFRAMLASFGAMATESFPTADATAQGRYGALVDRIANTLGFPDGQSVADIAADFSAASGVMTQTSKNHSQVRAHLEDALGEIENADPTETAAKLMAAQTRLQASYQTTATLQKLSLVDYL